MKLELILLPDTLAVCRLEPNEPIPDWAQREFVSITRTEEELSIVCPQERVPEGIRCQRDWR